MAIKKKVTSKNLKKKSSPKVKSEVSSSITKINKPFTKGQLISTLAERVGIKRQDISTTFVELSGIIAAHLKKQGPKKFIFPGLIKMTAINRPATKAKKGINPFTGKEMMFKAKPARNIVRVRPLKLLKEMA